MKATKKQRRLNTMNTEMGYAGDALNAIDRPTIMTEGVNSIGRILKRNEVLQIVGLSSAQLCRNIRPVREPNVVSYRDQRSV